MRAILAGLSHIKKTVVIEQECGNLLQTHVTEVTIELRGIVIRHKDTDELNQP